MVVLAPKAFANALLRVIEPGFWRSMEAGAVRRALDWQQRVFLMKNGLKSDEVSW